ncbi:MAG: metal-dependent transcriptional regulator [Elusimicrobiales bacterium]
MNKLSSSLEDYIEAAYIFEKKNGFSRIKEIADFLNVKLPAVNKAVKELDKRGFLTHQKYGYIKLTSKGKVLAENILTIHNMLVRLLKMFDISDIDSNRYACYMEHIIHKNSKDISYIIDYFNSNPCEIKKIKDFIKKRKNENKSCKSK